LKTGFAIWGLILAGGVAFGQAADYWQQEVHYRIDVALDDSLHTLRGEIEFTYLNHSPDALDTLYLHLWGNAFSDRTSAFARQQLRQGKSAFYFAPPEALGGYRGLDFRVDGQAVPLQRTAEPDIAYLLLPAPLRSGDSIRVQTPFTLRIPESFSRLGHVGQSYQLTQWYPKPAVYDHKGWHPMPYLDLGEYYGEFGSYDVRITLPANYVVAATGTLLTAEERDFLEVNVQKTDAWLAAGIEPYYDKNEPFPPSSAARKTIRYRAEHVHDFAWFADKRFRVQRSKAEVGSRQVDTWAFFTAYEQHLWQQAVDYVDRAVQFYSEQVGDYPYPQATAVQSALSAGSGMEYPMITVIGPAYTAAGLDEVITHEVGHNWFYGILAFHERRHPWMDEGINTYYEQRYMRRYHGQPAFDDYLPGFLQGRSDMSFYELAYLYQARRRRDQAPDTPSEELTEINYVLGAYQKPAEAFRLLEHYLSRDAFDRLMQGFYREWQLRHPYPEDLQRYLEAESDKDLDWLFDGLLGSNRPLDYALSGLARGPGGSYQVEVKNKGGVAAPFALSGLRGDSIIATEWYEGFEGASTLSFPAGDYDALAIDARRVAPDLYRQNNRIRTGGLFPRLAPPRLSLLPTIEDDARTQLYLLPAAGWNNYDGLMLGALLYNTTVPAKRFEFALAPMYSFGSKALAGTGRLAYHFYPGGRAVQEVTLGLGGQRFHFFRNPEQDYRLQYTRLMPFLRVELGKAPASTFTQELQWRTLWIDEETAEFSDEGAFTGTKRDDTFIHELSYQGRNRRPVNPFSFRVALEQQRYRDISGEQHYLRASLEWRNGFTYAEKKNIDLRLFAGGFLVNSKRNGGRLFPGAFNLIPQGYNDYRYDELYFGRTENEGFLSQQMGFREGGFKTPLGGAFPLGRSNNYILAFNLQADLPLRLPAFFPLKPFLDLGYFDNARPTGQDDTFQDQFLWSGGLLLDYFDGLFRIHFPLVNSRNLQDRLAERGNYWTRISFAIDFARLNPFEAVKRMEF